MTSERFDLLKGNVRLTSMGMYKYLQKAWRTGKTKELMKKRMISWRQQPIIVKIKNPTRLDRAHSLGYKAKQGFTIVRIRIKKGARKKAQRAGGRKPTKAGQYSLPAKIGLQHMCELKAARKHPNMEVLNSYYVAEDGKSKWFEIILVDPAHPGIKNSPKYNWILKRRGRAFRGLTSSARRTRMLGKGKGFERKGTKKR